MLGGNANTIKAVPDEFDPAKTMLTMSQGSLSSQIAPDSLVGGSLAGLMKFQNEDLTAANNLLGQMAAAVSGAVNTQQSLGLDLGQPASAGAPIFSVGAPRVLAGIEQRPGTARGRRRTVNDAGASVQASDYALASTGANYTLTRLRLDNRRRRRQPVHAPQRRQHAQRRQRRRHRRLRNSPAAGPAARDRFLLQPVALPSQNIQAVLGSPAGIAAASPFTGSLGVNNTGTATRRIAGGDEPGLNRALMPTITFTVRTPAATLDLDDMTRPRPPAPAPGRRARRSA